MPNFNDDWLFDDDSGEERPANDPNTDEDLPWLRDDSGQSGQSSGERTGLTGKLDWQKANPQGGQSSGDRTGLTGNLDWQKASSQGGPASGENSGLTGDLDWQKASSQGETPGQDRTGLTGSLDWQQSGAASGGDDDASAWLGELAGAGDDEPPPSQGLSESDWLLDEEQPQAAGEVPDWLLDDEEPSPAAPTGGVEIPDWLQDNAPQTAAQDDDFDVDALFGSAAPPAASAAEVPDWLLDDEEPSPAAPTGGVEIPDWLQDNAPQSAAQDDDFDVDALFGSVEPPAASAAEVPDWLLDEDEPAAAPTGGVEIPDWLQDSAPQPAAQDDDFDVDALFGSVEPPAASAAEVPDWLQGYSEPARPAQPELDALFSGGQSPIDADDTPDWMQDEAPAAEAPDFDALFGEHTEPPPMTGMLMPRGEQERDVPQSLPDNFLEELGITDAPRQPADVDDDFLSGIRFGDTGALDDPFADFHAQEPAAPTEVPDWLAEAQPDEAEPEPEAGDDLSWLSELGEPAGVTDEPDTAPPSADEFDTMFADFEQEAPAPAAAMGHPQLSNLDSLLSSIDDEQIELPQTGALLAPPSDLDLEALFADQAIQDSGPSPSAPSGLSPDAPDWLSDLGASVSQVSASALVRQRKDRPLEDLSDRLQNLRDRGMDLPTTAPTAPATGLEDVLGGIAESLPPAPIVPAAPAPLTGGVGAMSQQQLERVKLLRSVTGVSDTPVPGRPAIDATYDSPNFDWAEDQAAIESAPAAPVRKPRRRLRVPVERLLIVFLLLSAVLAPFFLDTARFGTLPPTAFAPNGSAQAFYDQVETLARGDLVLVALEYNATAAGELDPMSESVLYHILSRGARVVVISRNPVSLLRAGTLLQNIAAPAGSAVIARYLSADVVGLRALAETPAALLATDSTGSPTNLNITSLDQFALIVVFAERGDDLRAWAEQIAPMTRAPLVAGISYAAAPLSVPYQQAGIYSGLLVGAADAHTYSDLIDQRAESAPLPTQPPTRRPAPTQPAPTSDPAVPMQGEATAEGTADAGTAEAGDGATPAASGGEVFATIDARGTVNVRSGPGTDNAVVATVANNDRVQVLATTPDGSWINIRTPAGIEGWVSDDFVRFDGVPKRSVQRKAPDAIAQDTTPEPTAEGTADTTAEPSRTPRPTRTPTPEPTAEPTPEPAAMNQALDPRDAQWYASTLGLMVIVIVIALGTIFSLIRRLGRGNR